MKTSIKLAPCKHEGCSLQVAVSMGYCTTHKPGTDDSQDKKSIDRIRNMLFNNDYVQAFMSGGKEAAAFATTTDESSVVADQASTQTHKEERSFMNTFKSVAGKAVELAKKAAKKVVAIVKAHGAKSVYGLGALTLAGTVTHGLMSALVLGTLLYTAGDLAYRYVVKKQAITMDQVINSVTDAALYTVLGATVLHALLGAVVGIFAKAFVYSYLGHAYISYFVVA